MAKQKMKEHVQRFDYSLLKKAKKEVDKQRKKEFEMKRRVELQKVQRDVMLLEAQKAKIIEQQRV